MNQSKHLLTYDPRDGSYSCLRAKRGQGFDLRKLDSGPVEARRVSEIVWSDDYQAWFVQVLDRTVTDWMVETWVDEHPINVLQWTHWSEALGVPLLRPHLHKPAGSRLCLGRLLFDDYEDAVAAEVAFLDALRLKGIIPK